MAQRANGATAAHTALSRQPSLSSFPPSRSPSSISIRNDRQPARSPQPPMVRETEETPDSTLPHSRNSAESAQKPVKLSSKNPRKIRSQYPADSTENHVEYILVASFDIDRGSVMEHQYPGPISGDETMLAELMLPDQAHVRSQDWTIFFLHKDTSAEDEEREARRERRRRRRRIREGLEEDTEADAEEEEEEDFGDSEEDDDVSEADVDIDGPPLVYVLNLVNTKQDNTVKRGAIVKAMAICTRHSFLHIYKPLLLLALEEYFRSPVVETLASFYDALNAMDLSLLPKLSTLESFTLQSTDAKDMFIEKFQAMIQIRMAEDAEKAATGSPPSEYKPPTKYTPPRDTHEFESKVMYNGIPIPIKVPTAISPETVGDFSLIKLIQTFSTPHSTAPQPFALHPHLTTSGPYTHPIIVLINALLTQKRIIFLGHNKPSSEVAEAVLAACALASGGLLRGFVRYAFPYTDLTKIDDLLKVPGFIAGVTNPAFAHKAEWWDLLCDLTTGRMKISHKIEGAPVTDGLLFFQQQQGGLMNGNGVQAGIGEGKSGPTDPTGDTQFMETLLQSIANRHGENAIRARWRSWILKFTRIASAFEETVYGASALYIGAHETDAGTYGVSGHGFVWPDEGSRMRELAANVHRVEGWRSTRSYYSFVQDLAQRWTRRAVRGIDLHHHHDRLRCLRLTHDQSAAIYLAFARAVEEAGGGRSPTSETDLASAVERELTLSDDPAAKTRHRPSEQLQYDTILQLLMVVPESNSGLFYIALGLFHPKPEVRVAVVRLLERIMEHPAGRHFWFTLGRFAKLAFFRLKREEVGQARPA